MNVNSETEKISNERVSNAVKNVSKCLNILEGTTQELKWACESMNWNNEVAYQIEDACTKLGFSLATLVNWNTGEETDGNLI